MSFHSNYGQFVRDTDAARPYDRYFSRTLFLISGLCDCNQSRQNQSISCVGSRGVPRRRSRHLVLVSPQKPAPAALNRSIRFWQTCGHVGAAPRYSRHRAWPILSSADLRRQRQQNDRNFRRFAELMTWPPAAGAATPVSAQKRARSGTALLARAQCTLRSTH